MAAKTLTIGKALNEGLRKAMEADKNGPAPMPPTVSARMRTVSRTRRPRYASARTRWRILPSCVSDPIARSLCNRTDA
jgi:hypothetical protein